MPAKLTPEPTKHEARKRRANERHAVGCYKELGGRCSACVASNDVQEAFELFAAHDKRAHVRPDEVFSEIFIHLDYDWSRNAWFRHDEMITLRSYLDTTRQFADVTQLLPRYVFHAIAPRSAGAS